MGEFDTIWASQVPLRFPLLWFVAKVKISEADGQQHRFELRVLDEDSELVATATVEGASGPSPIPGALGGGNILLRIENAVFAEYGTFAFEFSVANEVRGIGVDVFDSSRDFGSRGRLRSVVDMDRLSSYPQDPAQPFLGENNALSVLGQECGHRWLAYLEFRDGATSSTALLGRDEAHWSFFFDSDASHMEGNDIEDRGNGQFRTVGAVSRYSALDQYAMGLRAGSDVPPMFLVTQVNSGGSASDAPRIGVDIRGTRKDVRIEDIVAAMGPRTPDFASSPKAFRQVPSERYACSRSPPSSPARSRSAVPTGA